MGFQELLGVNPFDAFFALLNALVLFFVLKKYLFQPVMKMITDRQQEIDDMYTKAGEAKEQAAAMRTEYEAKLSAAEAEAERTVKEAVIRGQNRQEEIIRQANAQASAIMDKASADIAQEKKKAINDAKDEISVIALAIAGKVVGKELNGEDQSQLVDQFIEELGEQV